MFLVGLFVFCLLSNARMKFHSFAKKTACWFQGVLCAVWLAGLMVVSLKCATLFCLCLCVVFVCVLSSASVTWLLRVYM